MAKKPRPVFGDHVIVSVKPELRGWVIGRTFPDVVVVASARDIGMSVHEDHCEVVDGRDFSKAIDLRIRYKLAHNNLMPLVAEE
jgi:hypothetical protein